MTLVIKVFKHENGSTTCVEAVDPAWLDPAKNILLWVVMDNPTPEEARLLSDVFHIHELSIEDALNEIHHPKIELYGDYLYLILHGIDFQARQHRFQTKDVDFFLSPKFLDYRPSREIPFDRQADRYLRAEQPAARRGHGCADAPGHRRARRQLPA